MNTMVSLVSLSSRARRALAVLLGMAGGLVAMPGCQSPEPVMTVQFAFGDDELGCVEAGVTVVDYTLFATDGVLLARQGVPCAELPFTYLENDTYELEVHGFDGEGDERFVGRCGGLVFSGDDVVHPCVVDTAVAPLEVEVRWDTTQSAEFLPGTCWTAGVVRYNVVLRDEDDAVVDARAGVLCEGPDTVLLDFGTLQLGTYQLEVTGFSDDDVENWQGLCEVMAGASGMIVCDALDG